MCDKLLLSIWTPPLFDKTVGEPVLLYQGGFLHNAKAIPTTRRAGGLFVLQSSVFRISEKRNFGEQGHALTIYTLKLKACFKLE